MGRRRAVLLLGIVFAVVTSGCSAGAVVPRPNRYANEVDGVTAGWPSGWERVDKALATFRGGTVDLLVLATFDPPVTEDPGCAQDAPAAVAAMREGDALFRLQAVRYLIPDRSAPPRPPSFMDAAQPSGYSPGCQPRDVVSLHVAFEEHDRLYTAELRARTPLSDRHREEVETIWANLELDPIFTGMDSADVERDYWHDLSTHCGITHTTFDGRDWVADPPLVRDQIRRPPGWEEPSEVGEMRLQNERSAVFNSRDGERSARFRPWVESDGPLRGCE